MTTADLDSKIEDTTKPTLRLFPVEGKVRAKQNSQYLGIALSTWWLYVKQGRIKQPLRYGKRVSVWDAEYIRELAKNGIPPIPTSYELGTNNDHN